MSVDPGPRRSGRTTRAMKEAHRGAFFVCPHPEYARTMARNLSRTDLNIITPSQLRSIQGTDSDIVVDHSCDLTAEQAYQIKLQRIRYDQRNKATTGPTFDTTGNTNTSDHSIDAMKEILGTFTNPEPPKPKTPPEVETTGPLVGSW